MQGTGVWSGIKMSRTANANNNAAKSQQKAKKSSSPTRFPNGKGNQAPPKK
jgi:hypothetical protein